MITTSKILEQACQSSDQRKHDLIAAGVLLALCTGVFFIRLGCAGIMDVSESFYPAAVREMIEARSYIVPQMNYQIYFSKPILTFWLLAASYHMFGLNEFAGRFFSSFLSTILVMACFWVVRCLRGPLAGFLAGALLAGSPYFVIFTRSSSIDAFFSVFLGLALCGLLMVLSAGRKRWWPLIYVSLALAVLTKGPAALVLFGVGCVLALGWLRPGKDRMRVVVENLHVFPGIALFSVLTLPWFVAVHLATKGLFLKVFVLYENFGRLLGHTNLRRAFLWRYLVVLLAGLLPWSLYVPGTFIEAWRRSKLKTPEPMASKSASPVLLDARIICLSAVLVVVGLFSLSKTQMETYVLPACAPLAMATALTLYDWLQEPAKSAQRWLHTVSALTVLATVVQVIVLLFIRPYSPRGLEPWMVPVLSSASILVVLGGVLQYWLFRSGKAAHSLIAMSCTMCFACMIAVPVGIEYWYNQNQRDLHELCRALRGTTNQLGLFMNYRPSVMYYAQAPVDCFFIPQNIQPLASTEAGARGQDLYVISPEWLAPRLSWNPRLVLESVDRRGSWGLYRIKNARLYKYPTLEQSFKWLTLREMVSLDTRHYGMMTDCWSGGTTNLPERLKAHR